MRSLLPDRPFRILMYSTYFPPHYSGAAKQAVALARHLRDLGHKVEFVTLQRQDEPAQGEHDGFRVWRIKEGKGRHKEVLFWFNFIRLAWRRRNDFDILHSHGAYYYNSFVGPLGFLLRKKSLVKTSMANNDLAGVGQRLSGRLHRMFLNRVDAYIAISSELKDELCDLDFPLTKIHHLPNGVDSERFKPLGPEAKRAVKHSLGLPEGQVIALSVGVFDQRKNIGWLIEQWGNNAAFGTNTLLLAVGPQSREDPDGSFINRLKTFAASHPNLIRIVGHTDRIEEYFQAADYFILPSTNEGMPNVILEAMASGLPCLATRVSGCDDLIADGENGLLFRANDAQDLQSALLRLSGYDLLAMSETARRMIVSKYSLRGLANRYLKLYVDLTGRQCDL